MAERIADPWRYALSVDRRGALVYDLQGRNLVELHLPPLTTGPVGRPMTFEQLMRLMALAPQLRALLEEGVGADTAGADGLLRPGSYRSRVLALLAACR